MFWVYALQNPAGKFYVGQTDNLPARLANHNCSDNLSEKFTRKNGPWTLAWSELHPSRTSYEGPIALGLCPSAPG